MVRLDRGVSPQRIFPNHCTWLSCLFLPFDVVCSLPFRRSHAEQWESGAPASPIPPTSENHHLSSLPDTTEFPTPPPTPPERHVPEASPTSPASPRVATPLAPASLPVPSDHQCEDPVPAPYQPLLRYKLHLALKHLLSY